MKKYFSRTWTIIAMTVLIVLSACSVYAKETKEDRTYTFDLSVNNEHEIKVQQGQIITVVFTLKRTDSDEAYTMYAMQNEIKYDENFVKPVENGSIVTADVQTKDIALRTGGRELYMNYVSFSDGVQWTANQIVGSFQMEVVGTEGASTLTNENYKVSVQDGSEVYEAEANDLTLVISDECTVTFETNDETTIDPVTVKYGSLLERPEDPEREGYEIEGWFRDEDLTEEWDFEHDTVNSNMTLYAKWKEAEKTGFLESLKKFFGRIMDFVKKYPWILIIPFLVLVLLLYLLLGRSKCRIVFETNGGSLIEPMPVKRKQKAGDLPVPTRSNSVFGGWYKDPALTKPWYADVDQIRKKTTKLYAKWR